MKKFTCYVAFALFAIIAGVGCKKSKNDSSQKTVDNINNVKVPSGFSWESSQTVAFSATVTDGRFGTAAHSIAIFDGDPYAGGSQLAEGTATTAAPFSVNIYIPKTLTDVYVVKTSPDQSKIVSKVNISGTSVAVSFAATDPSVNFSPKNTYRITSDCSSGCTQTITANASNVNVNTGDVICITGSNITVGFSNINGGMIRICGSNVTLQNCNLSGSSTLLVSTSGSATLSSFNFNSTSASVINDGTLTMNGSFADNGVFTNNGAFNCSSDFNVNSGAGAFTNAGTMNVSGNFNNGGPTSAINSGSLLVTGSFQQNNGAAAFINNCNLRVNGNYNQSASVKNYGFIKVLGLLTVNSSTELSLYNTAMISTNGFMSNSPVKGYGSSSLLKITGAVTVNLGGGVTGAVQVSSVNLFNILYLSLGAVLGSSLYIPTTGCNGEGNGTSILVDTDGDGVSDALDAYPTDPAKAYNNYYPSSTGSATVAFEDQWPAKSDYDVNDLVMGYKYKIVTNAANIVVQVTGNYTLYATGGDYNNGFAVQFPVASDKVSGLTSGYLQTGQTKAVVEIFNKMHNELAQWNTVPGVTTAAVKNYTVTFDVTGGPLLAVFGLSGYNPFIWHSKEQEVHLPGHLPTDNVSTSLFGTVDDNTSVLLNRYYVTKTGLPYAIDIPVAPFKYPTEGTDINKAYLHFADWVQSAGLLYTDWYSNTATGYRNTTFIYNN